MILIRSQPFQRRYTFGDEQSHRFHHRSIFSLLCVSRYAICELCGLGSQCIFYKCEWSEPTIMALIIAVLSLSWKQEKERRYKELGLRDKITLTSGRFVLGNKYVSTMSSAFICAWWIWIWKAGRNLCICLLADMHGRSFFSTPSLFICSYSQACIAALALVTGMLQTFSLLCLFSLSRYTSVGS